ncbi:MAG TPA: hypothetical protein DE315_08755 [Candidatus Omnitrophica bacterium]|nr:hypothetical protein [Candidatus Omnitrophota bacterium]
MPGFIPHPVRHNYWRTGGIPPHGCKRPRGFTIMELIIVVIIIGVLAAVALPSYRIQMLKMKNQEAIRILMAVWEAQKEYYRENGTYTNNIADLTIDIPASKNFVFVAWNAVFSGICPPQRQLACAVSFDSSYFLEVLVDGRIVCLAGGALCAKMGFSPC